MRQQFQVGYLKDERALEPLLKVFFTDNDERVRAFAAQGLGQWNDPRAVNVLIQALQDKQADVRRDAAEMLGWLKDERATNAFSRRFKTPIKRYVNGR